jgi:hypothetical protein
MARTAFFTGLRSHRAQRRPSALLPDSRECLQSEASTTRMADCQQVLLLAAENRLLLRHDLISQPFDANKFRGYLEQKRFNFKEAHSLQAGEAGGCTICPRAQFRAGKKVAGWRSEALRGSIRGYELLKYFSLLEGSTWVQIERRKRFCSLILDLIAVSSSGRRGRTMVEPAISDIPPRLLLSHPPPALRACEPFPPVPTICNVSVSL